MPKVIFKFDKENDYGTIGINLIGNLLGQILRFIQRLKKSVREKNLKSVKKNYLLIYQNCKSPTSYK